MLQMLAVQAFGRINRFVSAPRCHGNSHALSTAGAPPMRYQPLLHATLTAFLSLLLVSIASANTCNNFGSFTCDNGNPNVARLGGGSSSGQSVGLMLNGNNFSVF